MRVCVSAGVLVVYSMRWLQVGRCSPAPPWRTSSTSSSGYLVSNSCQASSPQQRGCLTTRYNVPDYLDKAKHCVTERLWFCHFRHSHRGELAGNLLHRRVQVLQLSQIQTTADNQPCSQVLSSVCVCVLHVPVSAFLLLFVCSSDPVTYIQVMVCVHVCVRHGQEFLWNVSQTVFHFLPPMSPHIPIRPSCRQTVNCCSSFCLLQAGQWRHRAAAVFPQSECLLSSQFTPMHFSIDVLFLFYFTILKHRYTFNIKHPFSTSRRQQEA